MDNRFFKEHLYDNESRVQDVFSTQHDSVWLNRDKTRCILFARGQFDNWCVYIVEKDEFDIWHAYAPIDRYYFERLYFLGMLSDRGLTLQKVYGHVLHMFEFMHSNPKIVSHEVINEIDRMCYTYYGDLHDMAFEVFMCVYFGMVAEENKEGTKLGRLIKMHGIHNLLCNQLSVDIAADCTRGHSWRDILAECDALGLIR